MNVTKLHGHIHTTAQSHIETHTHKMLSTNQASGHADGKERHPTCTQACTHTHTYSHSQADRQTCICCVLPLNTAENTHCCVLPLNTAENTHTGWTNNQTDSLGQAQGDAALVIPACPRYLLVILPVATSHKKTVLSRLHEHSCELSQEH